MNTTTGETAGKKVDVFEGLDPEVKVRTRKMMMWFIIFAIVMLFLLLDE
jgi:predicted nucleic acid-binding Zn ribbon protein